MKDSIQSMGGNARAEKLSPERRAQIASDAATARWRKDNTRSIWRHGGIIVETPGHMTDEEWEKLDGYVHLIKPDKLSIVPHITD